MNTVKNVPRLVVNVQKPVKKWFDKILLKVNRSPLSK